MAENTWTDETKQEVVEAYVAQNPTPETSAQILLDLAEQYEKTPNSIRRILSLAGVYISMAKKAEAKTKTTKEKTDKPARVSKEDAIQQLKASLEALSLEVDDAIIDKLTGKAAVYFTSLFDKVKNNG